MGKHPADWLLFFGSLLSVVVAILGVLTLPDRRRYEGLTWQARFVAENRRHPGVRATQLVCLTTAVVLLISYAVTLVA